MRRIRRVILRHIEMPLLRPFTTSFGTQRRKQCILVEVQNEDGASGWGESVAFPEPYYNEETLQTNWHMLTALLIPILENVGGIGHPDELRTHFASIRGNYMARSAIEGAIWDLYARENGVSLAQAIGGQKTQIEVGVSIGIQPSLSDLLSVVEGNVAKGYKRIKIKIKPGLDTDVIGEVRRLFPGIRMMADANSAYTLEDAGRLRQLDEYGLMMIEQPLAHNDIVDHGKLQRMLQTPICLDESIHSCGDARKAVDLGSCRIINIKIGRVGGISEAIRLHNFCAGRNIPVWCGGMLETGIGRAHNIAISSLPGFTLPGDTAASSNYWEEDIIEPEVTVEDGIIRVPDGPGIGFEPHRARIDRRTSHTETFHFGRPVRQV